MTVSLNAPDVLSVDQIRSHFPAMARVHNGHPVAYFDGPGGTQVPRIVGEAMNEYLFHHNANTHWAYPTSVETDEALAAARHTFADFLNAASPTEIAFGANMTTLVFHLARSICRELNAGDEIIVTELDHHANIDPWQTLAREKNIVIQSARMDTETGQLDWDHFESLLSARTRVIAIGAASNALGTINDVRRAVLLAQQHKAHTFVDAVHYAPHQLVDVQSMGCDFLACSAYKFYGPHVGILYGKYDLIEALDVPKLLPSPNHHAERLETGTQNHEGIVGAAAAANFLAAIDPDTSKPRRARLQHAYHALHSRSIALLTHLWESLDAIPGISLYGPAPDTLRTPTLSFTLEGVSSEQVTNSLAEQGLFTSHGDFYATTVVDRLGLSEEGLVRVGCACYSTQEEIDRLIAGVKQLAAKI